jgi:hypothetical protein
MSDFISSQVHLNAVTRATQVCTLNSRYHSVLTGEQISNSHYEVEHCSFFVLASWSCDGPSRPFLLR